MDLGTLSAGYTGLKAAIETIRAAIKTSAKVEADARVIEALEQLGKAQETFTDMRGVIYEQQEEIRSLKDQLRDQASWSDRATKFDLVTTAGCAVVYRSKEPPEHYACPVCFENKQVQILQPSHNSTPAGVLALSELQGAVSDRLLLSLVLTTHLRLQSFRATSAAVA